jgi:serine/threonine protein kinase
VINDEILARLIRVADEPDLSGTAYELRGEIGRGGMGTVYRAFDTRLQREVALKVTAGGDASEARIAASLEHPGIVPVYDVGTLPDGRTFHAMRLIRGKPLDLHLSNDTPLSERIAIFQKICEAVAFAHSHNVVHRDLKPSNVMVGAFGDVAILDWGVAERRRAEEEGSGATAAVVGTPRYMAPEQARGETASPSADIYSLGAILQFLLPENAAKPLQSIAAKASNAEALHRYESALALNADISRYLDGFAVAAHQENTAERAIRFVRRNRTLFLLIGAYFLARIAVYFFSGR